MGRSEESKKRQAEYLKAYRADPSSAYNTPEARAAREAYQKEYWSRPENVERRRQQQRKSKAKRPDEVRVAENAKRNEAMKRYYRDHLEYQEMTKARAKANEEKLKAENPEEYYRRRREYSGRHRAKNREAITARQREANQKARLANKEFVNSLKDGKPCADCGGLFPPFAMDFDHVNGDKFKTVAVMVGATYSRERILAEIEKCVLVCSNCHRTRTAQRRGGGIDMEEAV